MRANDTIMNGTLCILLGATGDLSRRKLISALYRLVEAKKISDFYFLFSGREQTSVASLLDTVRPYIDQVQDSILDEIRARTIYVCRGI